ncbi:hypothetical protein HYH02_001516 [Chlamydomonas schloesseri]|uniref:Plastocyanin-like domain-containing protein n=1 Tax=Chlamydomonas schloesseri TaxID=2026947 RepID=A0A835WTS4_9CHLO|nr:hypothetical protein HYH02_001516 [Chlamydomonas schloesseri]|eukprot:KAG2453289.1 hypothetical protein HYH02_001516 [Chlamydomonas schloesseri]
MSMSLVLLLLLAATTTSSAAGSATTAGLKDIALEPLLSAETASATTTSETRAAAAASASVTTATTPRALPRRRRMQANTQVTVNTTPGNLLQPLAVVPVGSAGSTAITMEAVDIKVAINSSLSLSFTAPRYTVSGSGAAANSLLTAPALRLDAVCSSFSLTLTNNLPFQNVSTCPYAPGEGGTPAFENGPHDLEWTNLHTHGLKMDPGAVSLVNLCEPAQPTSGFKAKKATRAQYYCDAKLSSEQMCDVSGDNVYVNDRPKTPVAPGATLRYTYNLGAMPPGVAWYHPHQHGSVGIQLPTASGPLIIPEGWLPNGLSDLYESANGNPAFNDLMNVIGSLRLETSTILRFDGFWFRNSTTSGTGIDDDSLPFLGLGLADHQNTTASPLLYDVPSGGGTASPKYANAAGRDWALVNGAFQPTITMFEKTYARWQVVNTLTMKWLDLTIQQVQTDGSLTPANCLIWLLGRDAVPLPLVPRRLQSRAPGSGGSAVSDLILASGNRADVLVKCNTAGTYVLASGAGPFHTNYAACRTPHCELFGDVPPPSFGVPRSANNLYGGLELAGAVLAVVKVIPRTSSMNPQADLPDGVARTKLERFAYLNYTNFPPVPTSQCFSFMNSAYGGMCAVNNAILPGTFAYVEEGSHQVWTLRDTTYHPFHLHETPVRITSLPTCATSVTNNWAVGDWADVIMLPVCLNGCKWAAQGSGGGACNSKVDTCDEVKVQWLAERYSAGGLNLQSGLCGSSYKAPTSSTCKAGDITRSSMFHCHVIPHEDEGCVAVVQYVCPGSTQNNPNMMLATCPDTTTYTCSMRRRGLSGSASGLTQQQQQQSRRHGAHRRLRR